MLIAVSNLVPRAPAQTLSRSRGEKSITSYPGLRDKVWAEGLGTRLAISTGADEEYKYHIVISSVL